MFINAKYKRGQHPNHTTLSGFLRYRINRYYNNNILLGFETLKGRYEKKINYNMAFSMAQINPELFSSKTD